MGDLILIADDDPDIRRFIEINLQTQGFATVSAADGEAAVALAIEHQPALVLLDVMMPRMDGFEVCRRIRADFRIAATPIIMLTARSVSADKVVGLTAGADDYIIKPFDPIELIARVQSTLRRTGEMRSTSPLTGLPGNIRIDAEIRLRAAVGEPFAVAYADLDDFKAYNDHYGFQRGDTVLRATAGLISDTAAQVSSEVFVGHIGGDDFLIICTPEHVAAICDAIVERFDAGAAALYDPADAQSGGFESVNRQGAAVRYSLVAISIGVATWNNNSGEGRRVADRAAEMKTLAKQTPGSNWKEDRRQS